MKPSARNVGFQYNYFKHFQRETLSNIRSHYQERAFALYFNDTVAPRFGHSDVIFDVSEVCSLLEWCFIISVGVSSDHSHLRCTGFAGSH